VSEPFVDRKEAARLLLAIEDASTSFLGYVKWMKPEWKKLPKFQLDLIDKLDKLEKGLLLNEKGEKVYSLLINMPPRHSKSAVATELFPAYYISRNPSRLVMSCSYNAELASDFGQKAKDYVAHPRNVQAFPEVGLDPASKAKDFWRTTLGGQYAGVGIGGTTTGRPANLLITDDPVKSREEAESATQRNKVWNYYLSALTTRKQPTANEEPAIEIMILTRWHPDDPAGRLMETDEWKEGRWMHVNYPARQEEWDRTSPTIMRKDLPRTDARWNPTSSEYVFTGKKVWALWEERFSLEFLNRRERLNPREFAALYQQQPYIEGGNILKSHWWRYYAKDERPEQFHSVIIATDTAFKKNDRSDYSAIIILGMALDGDIYLLDLLRGRWDFPELKRVLIHQNVKWRGKGLRAIYIEDKASGQSLIQELRNQSGMSIVPYKPGSDKVSRLHAVTPMIEGGRVYLPDEAAWLDDFIAEAMVFPSAPHDDQVDALSLGLDVLARTPMLSLDALNTPINLENSLRFQAMSSKGSLASQLKSKALRYLGS
jgi:predicted phage terminase large subunit-like protein